MAWGAKEVSIATGFLVGVVLVYEFFQLPDDVRGEAMGALPIIILLGEGIFWLGVKEIDRMSKGR